MSTIPSADEKLVEEALLSANSLRDRDTADLIDRLTRALILARLHNEHHVIAYNELAKERDTWRLDRTWVKAACGLLGVPLEHGISAAMLADFVRGKIAERDEAVRACAEVRERCAMVNEEWLRTSELLLHAGEMTAQEIRTVKAGLTNRAAMIRSLPTLGAKQETDNG